MFGLSDRIVAYISGGLTILLAAWLTATILAKNAEIKLLEQDKAALAETLDTCKADRQTLRGNEVLLKASIAKQNATYKHQQALAEAKHQAAENDRQRALLLAKTAEQKAAALLKAKSGADGCASADQLILEAL